jgi:subtilisin-like proprotein convertase family protein
MLRKGIGIGVILAVAVLAGTALAATKTFSSGNINKGIGSSHVTTQTLNVKKKGKIKDVNVGVALETNENSDYALVLDPPKGPMVHLASGVGGSGSGFGDSCASAATFDDETGDDIEDTVGVDTNLGNGTWTSEQWFHVTESGGLDTLNGKKMKGKWTLIALSTEPTGAGDLACFKLDIKS